MTLNFPGDFHVCFSGHSNLFWFGIKIEEICCELSKKLTFFGCRFLGTIFSVVDHRNTRKYLPMNVFQNLTLEPLSIWIQLCLRPVVSHRYNHMGISPDPFFSITVDQKACGSKRLLGWNCLRFWPYSEWRIVWI